MGKTFSNQGHSTIMYLKCQEIYCVLEWTIPRTTRFFIAVNAYKIRLLHKLNRI